MEQEPDFHPLLHQAFLGPSLMTTLSHLLLVEAVDKKGLCSNSDKLMGPHGRPDKPHRIFSSEISNWEGDGRLSHPRPVFSLRKVSL